MSDAPEETPKTETPVAETPKVEETKTEEAPAEKEKAAADAEGAGADGEASPDGEGPKIEGEAKFAAVETATGEEGEEELWKKRAKLFRFDKESNGWKERGTGEIKFLKNKENNKIRILMRRDGTMKICANHFVLPSMELKPNVGSDRSWVWSVAGDASEDEPSDEVFAIRFQSAEIANEFKAGFEEHQATMKALGSQ
eukprot:NODE_5705_length_917_cov_208.044081_g5482_i0.p1 GENE.NODE_5705_length_917_cov_208.044081_g5482_i0~~NODE_5705_length_917_cov_208.044081_g5482_i0.p1  ORF type:complete len:198 (+),score=71.98 NODE_5705_length_917_cov_208.044081_g5482_i0:56-649(+)